MIRDKQTLQICLKGFLLAAAVLLLSSQTAQAGDGPQKLDKTLTLETISFHVTCPNEGSLNAITITPSGLEQDNTPITVKEADGTVSNVEVADLNKDGSPEIYVFLTSAGSGAYGSLIAYSANHKKSLSEIYQLPLEDDKVNFKGYMGQDVFSISGDHLVRSFPVYRHGDSNAQPTGGTRVLEYKLLPGKATWQLKLVKSSTR